MKPELRQRLGAMRIDIDAAVAERQIDSVIAELRNPATASPPPSIRRVRIGVLLATSVLLLFPGAALAAENAVPGELLYPVKRAAEWLWSAVDPAIVPEHRIEELEEVVDRAAPYDDVAELLADAEEAVRNRTVAADLSDRLRSVRDRIATDYNAGNGSPSGPGQSSDQPVGVDIPSEPPLERTTTTSTTESPSTDNPRQPPTTTTTTSPPSETDRPPRDATTTTAPPSDRDRPPRDDGG